VLACTYIRTTHKDLSALAWFGDFVSALVDEFDLRVGINLSHTSASVIHSARNVQAGTSDFRHTPSLYDFEIEFGADFVL
jgi:hypothetical protein